MPKERVRIINKVLADGASAKKVVIKGALLVLRDMGMDRIALETDLPNPNVLDRSQLLSLSFEVPRGEGPSYLKKYFTGLPVQMMDYRDGFDKMKFSG